MVVMFEECTKVDALVEILQRWLGEPPEVAVVLGSGWRDQAQGLLEVTEEVDLRQLDNWPAPQVAGHGATLTLGTLPAADGQPARRVVLCSGRIHCYEGRPVSEVVRGVRALVRWGTPRMLLLNAAGSLREDWAPGTLMALRDHINFGLPNPLTGGQNCGIGPEFVDLVDLYSPAWRERLRAACPEVQEGVYVAMPGPSYETPAEVQLLAGIGGDAVGMSTVPEAIAAKALGCEVLGLSMMTNLAAGIGGSRPSHEEVLETAEANAAAAAKALGAAMRVA
jgi:purine-nucleoside phosphorylase